MNEQMKQAIYEFYNASLDVRKLMHRLTEEEHQIFATDYPFDKEFAEVVLQLENWMLGVVK